MPLYLTFIVFKHVNRPKTHAIKACISNATRKKKTVSNPQLDPLPVRVKRVSAVSHMTLKSSSDIDSNATLSTFSSYTVCPSLLGAVPLPISAIVARISPVLMKSVLKPSFSRISVFYS